MTIERPNHIAQQTFRSVREAGYAEEDVDVYTDAITKSYNRLLDAHYEAQVNAETATAQATQLAEANAVANRTIEQQNGDIQTLQANLNTKEQELTTATGKLDYATREIENLRVARDEALANVNSLLEQVNSFNVDAVEKATAHTLTIDNAADQAASLLRRAEEIATDHIAKAEKEANSIVGNAKSEISSLEESIVSLRAEKDLILSRLRDFFTYEVVHIDEMIDKYENIEVTLNDPKAIEAGENVALEEAEDLYYEDTAAAFVADTQYLAQEPENNHPVEAPAAEYQQPEPVYTEPIAEYEAPAEYGTQVPETPYAEPVQEYIQPVEFQQAPEVAQAPQQHVEDYAPQQQAPDTNFEDFTPPLTDTPVNTASVPVYHSNDVAAFDALLQQPTYPPVPATGQTGAMDLPAVDGAKKKRSFRDIVNGRK